MLQVSTGFKSLILGPYSFADIFEGGVIELRSGVRPATADLGATGSLLGRFTINGGLWTPGIFSNGLSWTQSGPFVMKPFWIPWRASIEEAGVVSWFRIVGNAFDDGNPSYILPRIDGDVGLAADGREMVIPNLAVSLGDMVPLQNFVYTIPPIVGL